MAEVSSQGVQQTEAKKIEQLRDDIAELQKFLELTNRDKVKQMISMDIRRLETEVTNLVQALGSRQQREPASSRNAPTNVKIINYAWDQSEKFVKLYVTLTDVHGVASENVKTDFSTNSVELQVLGLDNKNHQLKITNLLKTINPQESHHKVKKDMVVVFMHKTSPETWTYVTALEQKSKESKTPKFEDTEDPNESLMTLMKKMYSEGDDEMKRTIAKAWTEARTKSATGDYGPP